ncbi:SMC-Scp complex subunit ScpB [bacterium]|nr:MAG: SMC-Scp complex subunit ScpB [bacterium]
MSIKPETIIEALIISAPEPITTSKLAKVAGVEREKVFGIVKNLNEEYRKSGRSFEIREVAGGYAVYVLPDFAPWIQEILGRDRGLHLTRAMFETLAIIAIKQPITKPMIDKIRTVNSSAPIMQLLKQGLITIAGRQHSPGKPFLYRTTHKFLKVFGLKSAQDIPSFEELQKMFEGEDFSYE